MKIGILGTGHVGQALAKGLEALGHEIVIGSRTGDRIAAFVAGSAMREETFAETAHHAELVIVALKGEVAEAVVASVASHLVGKVVLDTTNPIAGSAVDGIVPYFTGPGESLLQRLQALVPQARFVKCFNSVAAHLMVHPDFGGRVPSMFLCGDDAEAKAVATSIITSLGWAPEDVGGAVAGSALEALCQIWCAPGFLRNDWHHAFAVLRS